jgi:hypothetical protein
LDFNSANPYPEKVWLAWKPVWCSTCVRIISWKMTACRWGKSSPVTASWCTLRRGRFSSFGCGLRDSLNRIKQNSSLVFSCLCLLSCYYSYKVKLSGKPG